MREAHALSAIGVPHVPAVFERGVLDRRLGVRGAGVRPGAAPGRAPGRAGRADAARGVRARRDGDPDRGRDGARSGLRALRPQAGEPVRRRDGRREAVRLRPGPQHRRRRRSRRVDQGGGAGRDARVHVARAVRGADGASTPAATSTRWAPSSTRCWRARRRSGGTRRRCSRATAAGAPRAVAPGGDGGGARGRDHALPGQGSGPPAGDHRRPAPRAAGGDRRRAGAPRGGPGPGGVGAERGGGARRGQAGAPSRPRRRASGARWRCSSSRARATWPRCARR